LYDFGFERKEIKYGSRRIKSNYNLCSKFTQPIMAGFITQSVEHLTAEWEVAGSISRTRTILMPRVFKITEK